MKINSTYDISWISWFFLPQIFKQVNILQMYYITLDITNPEKRISFKLRHDSTQTVIYFDSNSPLVALYYVHCKCLHIVKCTLKIKKFNFSK